MRFFIKNTDTEHSLLVQGLPTNKDDPLREVFPTMEKPESSPKFREVLRPNEETYIDLPRNYLIGLEIL